MLLLLMMFWETEMVHKPLRAEIASTEMEGIQYLATHFSALQNQILNIQLKDQIQSDLM